MSRMTTYAGRSYSKVQGVTVLSERRLKEKLQRLMRDQRRIAKRSVHAHTKALLDDIMVDNLTNNMPVLEAIRFVEHLINTFD